MKRAMVLAAAAVVVASNVWTLNLAKRNRSDATGGTVELTERELALPPMSGDSTAMLLELKWDVHSTAPEDRRSPEWLNAAKLTELGFDCHVPVTRPDARDHYAAMSTALVYVVLEFEDVAGQTDGRDQGLTTRLFAVDAGRDARRLREKYPNPARYIITQGVVRLSWMDRSIRNGTPLAQPRLRGWIETILPDRVFVPHPYNKALQSLRRRGTRTEPKSQTGPRFAVTVAWGSRYEPWVKGVRMLPATSS